MDFRALGPLELWANGEALPLGGAKPRALLAVLLLRANEVVARDVLIDALWGDDPPASATHTLDAYVHRLRKALEGAGEARRLVRRPPGYLLRVEPGELDLHEFERLVTEGRRAQDDGHAALAAARLRQALALWRGPLFGDLEGEPFALLDATRLSEQRLVALEDRIDADLACGSHGDIVAELETLTARHPLRERLRAQQMLALYRSGRQADALAVYRDTRAFLAEELGLEPGDRLKSLEVAILRHDAALAAPGSRPRDAPSPRDDAPPEPKRHRRRAAVAATFVVGVAFLAGLLRFTAGDGETRAVERADGLFSVRVDGTAPAMVALDQPPDAVSAGFGSIWVAEAGSNTVVRVDPAGGVRQTIAVGSGPVALATAGGALWVANNLDGTISRIDPAMQTVVQTIRVAGAPVGLAVATGTLWVAGARGNSLVRLDVRTGRPTGSIALPGRPTGLVAGAGALWVTSADARAVWRIDPRSRRLTATIRAGGGATAPAFGGGAVWIANSLDGTISRLDSARDVVTMTVPVGNHPTSIAIARGSAWVADDFAGALVEVDAQTGARRRTLPAGGRPAALAVAAGRLWVAAQDGGRRHRGGTLVLLNRASEFTTIDPALQAEVLPPQLLGMTNDGLVSFAHVGGRDGTVLVPDLATAVPAVAHGNRRYVFRLRRGIRYSDGSLLRASDLRRGIERLYRLGSGGALFYSAIRGADRCAARPRACDLSRGIVTDDRAGTVTFRLARRDPDFLARLALPYAYAIAPGTPGYDIGRRPVPATGPYRIVRYAPGRELRLTRNPYFREWSHTAQPDGYPDVIVWKLGVQPHRGLADIVAGRADWFMTLGSTLPAPALRELRTTHPALVHVNPLMQTDYLILNVNVPPFDDIRVRRAVNYALDRRAVARVWGPRGATPSCQILPPQMPGYQRYCPYTRGPAPDGRWRGPDLARARRLIAASGTKGMHVTVWNSPEPGSFMEEMRAAVRLLRRLGYRAKLKIVPTAEYARASGNSRHRVQASSGAWSADYPSPSAFVTRNLSCAAFTPNRDYTDNAGGFCDPPIDRQATRAALLQDSRPDRAARLWARIDRELVDRAVWLPMVTPTTADILSSRVGNFQFHRLWGLLVDQLWVR